MQTEGEQEYGEGKGWAGSVGSTGREGNQRHCDREEKGHI